MPAPAERAKDPSSMGDSDDGCDVHRLSGSGIVDPEAVHQKGYRRPGSEMHKIKFSLPPAGTENDRPNLCLHRLPALR